MLTLEVKLGANIPEHLREGWFVRPRRGDVGYDLRSVIDFNLDSLRNVKIPTGVHIHLADRTHSPGHPLYDPQELSVGYYAKVEDRSSMAAKGITVLGGIIDPSYRGEIFIVLQNCGAAQHVFKAGDKIAQLIFHQVAAHFDVSIVDNLMDSVRGSDGFGSTGIR